MAKIDKDGGVSYQPFNETWEPTMHLAFFAVHEDQAIKGVPDVTQTVVVKKLHQQWRSNIGRTRWRPVVEMDPNSPDNE